MNKKPIDIIENIHNQKREDLLMGELNEDYIKDVICCHFKIDYIIKTPKGHPMDFKSDNIYFEIKSRRCKHNTYNTTMIGYNKIQWVLNNNIKDVYFIFVFQDGDYYYKYNPTDNFDIDIGGRNDRGKPEYKKYFYIPINKLKLI
jgi:hypothetical protein